MVLYVREPGIWATMSSKKKTKLASFQLSDVILLVTFPSGLFVPFCKHFLTTVPIRVIMAILPTTRLATAYLKCVDLEKLSYFRTEWYLKDVARRGQSKIPPHDLGFVSWFLRCSNQPTTNVPYLFYYTISLTTLSKRLHLWVWCSLPLIFVLAIW